MKVFQIHRTIELDNGQVLKGYQYHIAESKAKALKGCLNLGDMDCAETYAIQVSKQSIKDEIFHCEELIRYWEGKPTEPNVDVIILRQKNLIRDYKQALKKLQ